MRKRRRNVVYSSADDDFQARPPERSNATPKSQPPAQQTIRIQREKKGRGGKQVTVLRGFQLTEKDLVKLGKQLKKACGSGGTVKDDVIIEIQGDHRDKIANLLHKQGFKTKFTGG
ncbi:stress response translation initiation inhibitor YciH [Candidatus Leptofilum sp.]|uniref:stress response translation initiation inhibitor YciH n=1 Tax=Candidatus Leptofilum sp. TaxID=3241576 RepID=UPI003B5907D9